MSINIRCLYLLTCLCWVSGLLANDVADQDSFPSLKVGGLMFGDLYHVTSHHSKEGEGATGLVMRRAYLTFNARFNNLWFGRLRFEANQSGEFETYTYTADFKDLYIGRHVGRHDMLLGLSPTPTFDLIESTWGLRYLMRTPLDLQGVASRDSGFASRGPINTTGTLSYRAMIGAGVGFGNETGDKPKWMGALSWEPAPNWIIDLYADYEGLTGSGDRTTLQAFAGYQSDTLRGGIQYSQQNREDDPALELVSAFGVKQLGQKTRFVARVDRLIQPSPAGDNINYLPFDPSAAATMIVTGLEYSASPHFTVTPNLVVTTYDHNDEGVRPRTDVYLRLTLFIDFE